MAGQAKAVQSAELGGLGYVSNAEATALTVLTKSQCDSIYPICGQCLRTGRLCSGSRNVQKYRFLDETAPTKPKNSTNYNAVQPNLAKTGGETEYILLFDRVVECGFTMPTTFPPPLTVLRTAAIETFSTQYACIGTAGAKTDFDFVLEVYGSLGTESMLADVMAAIGFLVLEKQTGNHFLGTTALEQYAKAVAKLRKVVSGEENALSDQTVSTISLLALHEVGFRGCTYKSIVY